MSKLIYLLFFTILAGQQPSEDNIQNISIVSTSNVFSEFYDCGCPKNPLGGLARKTFFLKNMMSGRESILVDAGNSLFDSNKICLLYTSPSPRDRTRSRMPSSA